MTLVLPPPITPLLEDDEYEEDGEDGEDGEDEEDEEDTDESRLRILMSKIVLCFLTISEIVILSIHEIKFT